LAWVRWLKQLALKFGQRGEEIKHKSARSGACVDGTSDRNQPHA
jgi:hypothetical protein